MNIIKKNLTVWMWGIIGSFFGALAWKVGLDGLVQTMLALGAAFAALRVFVFTEKAKKSRFGDRRRVNVLLQAGRDTSAAAKKVAGISDGNDFDLFVCGHSEFGTMKLSDPQKKKLVIKFLKGVEQFQNCEIHLFYHGPFPVLANIFRHMGYNFSVKLYCYDTDKECISLQEVIDRTWLD
jgi:hypothetical protein